MDLVLGLSLTTASLRWVLVEGATGEGEPIDRGELVIPAIDDVDADLLVHAVLNPAVVAEDRIRVVGVTSTADAGRAAAAVVDALVARGHHDVAPVSDTAAVAALATGIADITDYDDVTVCIVEPDSAFVAVVDAGEVTVHYVDRPADGDDALELTSSVIAVLDREPAAVFVIGSDDVGVIVTAFEAIIEAPVFSAAEADLALARGAALVAARTLDMSGPPLGGVPPRRAGVLFGVLAVAVVTFVVSVSTAIGLNLSRDEPVENFAAAAQPERVAAPPPQTGRPAVRFPDVANAVANVVAKTMTVAVPQAPPPAAAPAYVPPAPVAAPPPPVYVPPPPPPQQPRLRDRIIERIPIIGRFHEPGQ